MKRGFIRALWGVYPDDWHASMEDKFKVNKDNLYVKSRVRVDSAIRNRINDKRRVDFRTYVFGKKNFENLVNIGVKDVVMIHADPVIYTPLNKRVWWHKLDILKYAMEEDGYDEIVYLDWDCYLIKDYDCKLWDILNGKETFQACLMKYQRGTIITERTLDKNVVPNGGFVYLRGKDVPNKISLLREDGSNKWLDEAAYARYVDSICGGWIGVKEYGKRFEPDVCWFKRGLFQYKDAFFRHCEDSQNEKRIY